MEFDIGIELNAWVNENPALHFSLLNALVRQLRPTFNGEVARAEIYRARETGLFYVKLIPHAGSSWQQVWKLECERGNEHRFSPVGE